MNYEVIVTCAVTGAGDTVGKHPAIPVTPKQIADYSLENRIGDDYPATFLLHALDDPTVPVENSLNVLAALRTKKIAAECHLFQEGGHGFGIRLAEGKPCRAWPDLVLAWGKRNRWLT